MKQVPKGLAMLSCSVDKTLAGGILAVALIGGAPLTAHSTDIMGGVKSDVTINCFLLLLPEMHHP